MGTRFDAALNFVLKWEGGYTNDPDDHGGATNLGIIQTEYDRYRKSKGLHVQSVKKIKWAEAAEIYKSNYWVPMKCDTAGVPMDMILFDTAVNLGLGEARIILSRHPGNGVVMDKARNYLADRDDVYRQIAAKPGQSKFLRGWLNRTADLRKVLGIK